MKCQNKFIYEIFKLVKFQKNVIFFYGTLMQTWYNNDKKNWFVSSAINQFTHARMKRFHKKNTGKKNLYFSLQNDFNNKKSYRYKTKYILKRKFRRF